MLQKIGKKIKLVFYVLIIIILTSINNYNFISVKPFNVKFIQVNGFSKEKNEFIKNEISKIYDKSIFFLNKNYFSKLIERNDTKYLYIKRNFPNKLIINFIPAKPICIIENKNDKIILGDNGKILESKLNKNNLPTVLGSNNFEKIFYVANLLNESNIDYSIIKKIIFFKSGRFDIYLNNKIVIKFPIKFNLEIINYSNNLLNKKNFNKSKVIDLRVKNKIIKYE